MNIRKPMLAMLMAASIFGATQAPLALAESDTDIIFNIPPPTPREEAIPAARDGYYWVFGYWGAETATKKHVWVPGHWEKLRVGHTYVQPAWKQRDDRFWILDQGGWQPMRPRSDDRRDK